MTPTERARGGATLSWPHENSSDHEEKGELHGAAAAAPPWSKAWLVCEEGGGREGEEVFRPRGGAGRFLLWVLSCGFTTLQLKKKKKKNQWSEALCLSVFLLVCSQRPRG